MTRFKTILEVKPSTIPNAGNGVFTKTKIRKWEPVCYYAGIDVADSVYTRDDYGIAHPWGEPITRRGTRNMVGTHGVAQLVNDACKPRFDLIKPSSNGLYSHYKIVKVIHIYEKVTFSKRNISTCYREVSPNPDNPWVYYALRDIEAGEELFFPYGFKYWTAHDGFKTKFHNMIDFDVYADGWEYFETQA